MKTGMILGSKISPQKSGFLFFCDRTRSDRDENRDDDRDDSGMMRSGVVGFLWQQLIRREGVYSSFSSVELRGALRQPIFRICLLSACRFFFFQSSVISAIFEKRGHQERRQD